MNTKLRSFLCYYLIALAIPIAIVATGVLAPGLFGLQEIGDFWPLLESTMEEAGVHWRGSALVPVVRVALIQPVFWLLALFAVAPTIAGVIMAAATHGRRGLALLVDRLRPWREGVSAGEGVRWWGVMAAFLLVMKLFEFGLYRAFGLNPVLSWGTNVLSVTFLWYYLSAAFLDQGGLLEEVGWRGYALPLLQDSLATPLRAAVVLGLFWAVWHLPREAAGSYDGIGALLRSQLSFFVVSVFLTIIISYFWNKVGGSTLMAIAVHGLSNDSVGISGTDMTISGALVDFLHAVPYVVFGSALVFFGGQQLGYRGDASVPTEATAGQSPLDS